MERYQYRGRLVSVKSDAFCYPESYLQIYGGEKKKKEKRGRDYLNILVTEICFK